MKTHTHTLPSGAQISDDQIGTVDTVRYNRRILMDGKIHVESVEYGEMVDGEFVPNDVIRTQKLVIDDPSLFDETSDVSNAPDVRPDSVDHLDKDICGFADKHDLRLTA